MPPTFKKKNILKMERMFVRNFGCSDFKSPLNPMLPKFQDAQTATSSEMIPEDTTAPESEASIQHQDPDQIQHHSIPTPMVLHTSEGQQIQVLRTFN